MSIDPTMREHLNLRHETLRNRDYYLFAWRMSFSAAHDWKSDSERSCCADYVCLHKGYWRGFDTLEDAVAAKLASHFTAYLIDATIPKTRNILNKLFETLDEEALVSVRLLSLESRLSGVFEDNGMKEAQ